MIRNAFRLMIVAAIALAALPLNPTRAESGLGHGAEGHYTLHELGIEFSYPSENGGYPALTFLSGTAPRGFDLDTVRYYSWTSVTRDGELVAGDYAPDTGWITADTP